MTIGVAALAVASIASARFGAAGISWHAVFHAYLHDTGSDDDVIVRDLRGPEILVAIEVGAALAAAGALMQGLTRNPLADTGILGINAGAALFVIIGIAEFGVTSPEELAWFAFPGAALGTGLAFSLAVVGRGRATPLKLTLAGVITGAILGGFTQLVLFLHPQIAQNYIFWASGDVNGRTMQVVYDTGPVVAVGIAAAILLGPALNGLSLGEDVARSLGQRVERTRLGATLATVLLAGAAVAAAGPMAFVGLAAANIVRSLIGNDYRWILPLSAVYGAAFVVTADLVGRVILRPEELETGIAVSIIGAPIMIYLVSRRRLALL